MILKMECAILCEALRSVSKERPVIRWSRINPPTLAEVEDRVRILLGL